MKKFLKSLAVATLSIMDQIAFIRIPTKQDPISQKASIKFSAFITDIKGKIGGTVFQGSKVGGTVKNKPNGNYVKRIPWTFGKSYTAAVWADDLATILAYDPGQCAPDGSNSPYIETRSTQQILRSLSKTWGTLTPDQRNAWNAAAVNFPFKNKYGDTYIGSGYQVFMSINAKLLPLGQTLQTLPPSASDGDLATWPWSTISILSEATAAEFLQIQIPDGIIPGAAVVITMYPPMSAGKLKTVFGGKGLISVTTEDPSSLELLPLYLILFGTPLVGSTINFKIEAVNLSNGHVLYENTLAQVIPSIASAAKLKTVFGGKGQFTELPDPEFKLDWTIGNTTYDLGDIEVDHASDRFYYIIQALQLAAKETVQFTVAGTNPENFVFQLCGTACAPFTIATIKAGTSGYVTPQPLWVTFQPDGAGEFSCTLTIQAASLASDIVLTFTGTGV